MSRVRLETDLTGYDKRCIVGSEGVTGPPLDIWAKNQPSTFVGVYFDSGARLDVKWKGLTILEEKKEEKEVKVEWRLEEYSGRTKKWHVVCIGNEETVNSKARLLRGSYHIARIES